MRKSMQWLIPCLAVLLLALCVCAWGTGLRDAPEPEGVSSASLGLVLLESERGVYVLAVSDRSAAWYAGLQPGDVILSAGNAPLESAAALDGLLAGENDTLMLAVLRDQQLLQLELTVR